MFLLKDVTCGGLTIDSVVPGTIHLVVVILKVAIPIILIIFGMLDLAKAVMANEEKEMKEAQKKFIKRVIYAVMVFFVIALVQFVFRQINKNGDAPTACIDCFINGKCGSTTLDANVGTE